MLNVDLREWIELDYVALSRLPQLYTKKKRIYKNSHEMVPKVVKGTKSSTMPLGGRKEQKSKLSFVNDSQGDVPRRFWQIRTRKYEKVLIIVSRDKGWLELANFVRGFVCVFSSMIKK